MTEDWAGGSNMYKNIKKGASITIGSVPKKLLDFTHSFDVFIMLHNGRRPNNKKQHRLVGLWRVWVFVGLRLAVERLLDNVEQSAHADRAKQVLEWHKRVCDAKQN